MKKVTRILGLCALMALVTVSCKKNENTKGGVSFLASITQPTNGAKTHIGADNFLMWNENDAIKVYNTAGEAETFTTSDKDVTLATFNGDITETETYYACYPENNTIDIANAKATLALSATQLYAKGGFADDTYPMVAINAGNQFNFRSPFGVLCLQLKGTATVGSIELTDSNMGLAGDFTVALDAMTAIVSSSTTGNTITLSCPNGVALNNETAENFFMVVPAGAFSNGFTAVVKDVADNTIHTLETSADNTLLAENILTMPEIKIEYATPSVVTNDADDVTQTTATINGAATAPAGTSLTECGFYWGTSTDALNNKVTTASATSPFSYGLTGLTANTTYYFKAYAKNQTGENYGEVKSFTTKKTPVEGRFKVADDRFVEFAPGNLYINEETHVGAFESHCYDTHTFPQYDPSSNCWGLPMISTDAGLKMDGSTMYYGMGVVDIADGWSYNDYWPYTIGNPVDWAESLPSNTEGWYTMPQEEAEYLLEHHTYKYCFVDFGGSVGVRKGLVIMPFGWEGTLTESINNATWQTLEAEHAAFLPAMGMRNWIGYGYEVTYWDVNPPIMYWTSTVTPAVVGDGGHAAGGYSFGGWYGDEVMDVTPANGDVGMCVRLVKPYVSGK